MLVFHFSAFGSELFDLFSPNKDVDRKILENTIKIKIFKKILIFLKKK